MHIVLVLDQYDDLNNGTTATARRFAQELRRRGHRVTILSSGEDGPDKVGVPERKIPFFGPLIRKQGFRFAKSRDEAYYQAFLDADIVHFYLPTPFCRRGEEIARQMKVPAVAAFHLQPENVTYSIGLGKSRRANELLYSYFFYKFYNRFRYIHCPSRFIADQLEAHDYGARCRVISNGVGDQFTPGEARRPDAFRDKFVVLMIGRLSGEKRQDLVIEAAAKSRYADRLQLIFAGQGPKETKYRKLGETLKNEPVFGFYPQDELLEVIRYSDLYVHASDAEIEGISCMEATACGLVPVISDSRLSAANDFALDERSLFRAGDAASLAEKIDFWIENPGLRAEMGGLYAEKARHMRVGACVAKAEQMYREAIADYEKNGSRTAREAALRRMSHPDADKVNEDYADCGFVRKFLFAAFTNLLAFIVYLIDAVFYGFKIEGRDNLRHIRGGAVTISNHIHPMDCTMVKIAAFPRRLYFTSLRRNLELPLIGWLIKLCGALPLPAEVGGMVALQRNLKQGIGEGDWVHFYPEGMLVRDHDDLREFRPGAFFTAVGSGCPVVPMVFTYHKPRGLWRFIGPRTQLKLQVGKPQYPDASLPRRESTQELSQRTYAIMQEMKLRPLPDPAFSFPIGLRILCVGYIAFCLLRYAGIV